MGVSVLFVMSNSFLLLVLKINRGNENALGLRERRWNLPMRDGVVSVEINLLSILPRELKSLSRKLRPLGGTLSVAALLDFSAARASACTLLYTASINLAADKIR